MSKLVLICECLRRRQLQKEARLRVLKKKNADWLCELFLPLVSEFIFMVRIHKVLHNAQTNQDYKTMLSSTDELRRSFFCWFIFYLRYFLFIDSTSQTSNLWIKHVTKLRPSSHFRPKILRKIMIFEGSRIHLESFQDHSGQLPRAPGHQNTW